VIDLYAIDAPESARERTRRRLQQRRCLVCGARGLANRDTSYFCRLHISAYRYCSTCETLRTTAEHGKDSRCKGCASEKALAYYRANSDANIYRIRLKELATRQSTRGDQILAGVRRRIALAALVRATPGWSWPKRAALVGMNRCQLARNYRQQCAGRVLDADQSDRARDAHWSAR